LGSLTTRTHAAKLIDRMPPDLSIALCLRDDERRLAAMASAALEVAETLARELAAGEWVDATRVDASAELEPEDEREDPIDPADPADAAGHGTRDPSLDWELIALDESSRDNTLSVLSILHAKLPQLRTIQGLVPGTAVMRAARIARGRVWLIADAPFDPDHGLWAARQVFCGDRAAIIPGEVLAVHRNLGQAALGWLSGGLVSAQREVERMLESHGQRPAWSPPRDRAIRARAQRFARGRLGRLGFGRLDRA
jgi:hypothetical protein